MGKNWNIICIIIIVYTSSLFNNRRGSNVTRASIDNTSIKKHFQ